MKGLGPGIALTVQTAPAIEELVVLVQVGLMVPVEEAVVLPPKDSKLAPVLLLAVILGLDAHLTAHAADIVRPVNGVLHFALVVFLTVNGLKEASLALLVTLIMEMVQIFRLGVLVNCDVPVVIPIRLASSLPPLS